LYTEKKKTEQLQMQIDKISYTDLAIFVGDEEQMSVFDRIDFTTTNNGRSVLKALVNQPLQTKDAVVHRQATIQYLAKCLNSWPTEISNGTIIMIEKFYNTAVDTIPANPSVIAAANYKTFSHSDYALIKFSVTHFADFFRGMYKITKLINEDSSEELVHYRNRVQDIIAKHRPLQKIIDKKKEAKFSTQENLVYGQYFKGRAKHECYELLDIYGLFDAWLSMAKAAETYHLNYPLFVESQTATIHAKGLFHILLDNAISYDVELNKDRNFLFLTGANMAGKSTYIKAVGIAVFLAHLGMAVPATQFELCFFDGLLSNIQVVDNISKGESYFFNEVQRIKNTVQKINDGKRWLVLIDELFKGTNVQDAMKCSSAVIKGLLKLQNAAFVLSTHLYEIGEELNIYPNIIFQYFETSVVNGKLEFSYALKNGISNDRLGYLILQQEGVVDLLNSIKAH
jgi:DNA mismatch repair ATPase MutS